MNTKNNLVTKFNSLPKEDQAKEIRSLMRLFSKIERICTLDNGFDRIALLNIVQEHRKDIIKQIKHFTKLFNDEVEESININRARYEDEQQIKIIDNKDSYKPFHNFCNSVKDMSQEERDEKLKETQEEQWLKNSDTLHKSGLLQRIAKKVYNK